MEHLEQFMETQVSSSLVYDGSVVHLYVDTVRLPNGETATREYAHHIGAVGVLPLTEEGDVLCVRQYRYAHRKMMLEIPAGKLDSPDEDPVEAAKRELREETGARCGRLTSLGLLRSTPAVLDEKIHLFLAQDLTFGETDLDEDEFLEVERIPLATLVEMVLDGRIEEGKTQIAILKVWTMLQQGMMDQKEARHDQA